MPPNEALKLTAIRWAPIEPQNRGIGVFVLTKITIAKKITVQSAVAWAAISKIGRLEVWFPSIATCRVEGDGVGAHRYMTVAGGGEIVDRIVQIDSTRRQLTYQRISSPFPVSSYRGTVEVFESFDLRAVVVWTVEFDSEPKDADAVANVLRVAIGAGVDGMDEDLRRADG